MTNRICAAFCASYSYFATEYSTECYCGNVLNANSLPVTDKRCNMPCKANATEICGGPNGLTLFKLDLSASSSLSLSSTLSVVFGQQLSLIVSLQLSLIVDQQLYVVIC
ncbi:hypothetical protein N0V91_007651 [Didymella pomorum]|uniref:WSC domain-containing protein n=1 Tax=Didymella pomorum TaxID=749634 RepID=A0A9W9D5H2_9PLEO|nr:hypothetical protein N0V91_007651 [Didymella pomorum]